MNTPLPRINVPSMAARADDSACEALAAPEDAVRLGADAFAISVFLRGATEGARHLATSNNATCVLTPSGAADCFGDFQADDISIELQGSVDVSHSQIDARDAVDQFALGLGLRRGCHHSSPSWSLIS